MPVALITGASRGLGRALARAMLRRGWRIVADARDGTALHRAFDDPVPGELVAVPGDVTHPTHRGELARAVRKLGGLDLLVNNASTLGPSPQPTLDRYPLEELERVLEVNTLAPLALIQALLPELSA